MPTLTPISPRNIRLGMFSAQPAGRRPRTDRVRFITHESKQILFIDVTNCAAEEVIELLTEVQHTVTAQPPKSVLTLSDLTGARFSRSAVTRMKEVAVFDRPYVKRAAFVGAQSLPKVFYDALKTFEGPIFEVHISNIHARDELHRHSKLSSAVKAVICGIGPYGYIVAMQSAAHSLGKMPAQLPPAVRDGPR